MARVKRQEGTVRKDLSPPGNNPAGRGLDCKTATTLPPPWGDTGGDKIFLGSTAGKTGRGGAEKDTAGQAAKKTPGSGEGRLHGKTKNENLREGNARRVRDENSPGTGFVPRRNER